MPGSVMAIAVTSSPLAIPGSQRSLFVGAVAQEVRQANVVVQADAEARPADAGGLDLLVDHEVVAEVVDAPAAVLLGDRHAEEAVLTGLGEEVVRHDAGLLVFEVVRHDLVVEPPAEALTQRLVLFFEDVSFHWRHSRASYL
jgi:hypothetical protein